ncbi:ABC transporter permease [Paracoccus albus]|uniref:ABC transporter permease n=1 Tax=Paracoccus albus TaxID=3017784 RepID=UPI0022F10225|nr:ABC transporter permease [Paracoccus albus]WBU61679.1 ABC transporter permease [Paracoccus albus]
MTGAVLLAFWSHWRRNPLQFVTLILGIAIATALWTGVQAINAEARASMQAATRGVSAANLARLERQDGGTIPVEVFVRLRRAGVLVSPIVQGEFEAVQERSLMLSGVDPLTAPDGLWPDGDFMEAADRADTLFVAPNAGIPDMTEDAAVPDGQAVADLETAMRLLGRTGYDALLVISPQPLNAPDPQQIVPGLSLIQPAAASAPAALTDSFRLNLTAFGALCFLVGLFIVRSTIGLALSQRRRAIVVLRALGAPATTLALLILLEMTLIAAAAGGVGVLLGYLLASGLMPGVAATMDGIYGAQTGSAVSLRPVWWLGGLGMAVAGTLLSAAGPMLAMVRNPVTTPAGYKTRWWLLPLGCVLIVSAAGLARWGDGLLSGFATIAALLLGGAALMPAILAGLLHLLRRRTNGAIASWTVAEARSQIPQISLAMTALLMALAANIGVSTMVGSFRQSFTTFIDQRLAAEIYVATPDGAAELENLLDPDERLLPLWSIDALVADQPSEIYGVADDPTYRGWSLLTGGTEAWAAIHENAAIINEQLAYRAGLSVGDEITLPDGTSEIAGIIADYGNPLGKVYISDERLRQIAPDEPILRHAVRTSDPKSLLDRLESAGIAPDRIGTQDELKAASVQIFERTFAVTAALNALTLAVAGIAVLTSLLASADARVPRLTPLWAMGVRRRTLSLLELARVSLIAALTSVLALPLGIALSWLLLAVINVEAFGWRLPFRADPVGWSVLIALGIFAAMLAALWPAWRLARISPRALSEVTTYDG